MECKCHKERQEDRKWKAAKSAKEIHSQYGCTVIVERDEDIQGKRIFWVYTVSKDCHLHRVKYLHGKGIVYI